MELYGQCTWRLLGSQLPATAVGMLVFAGILSAVPGGRGNSWCLDGILLFFLLFISIVDIRCGMIFNRVLLPLAAAGILNVVLVQPENWASSFGGAMAGGSFLWLLRWLSHGGLGGGDVKLAFVLGIWLGGPGIAAALWLAFLLGGCCAAALLSNRCWQKSDSIPFGPFLCFGAFILYFYGGMLWDWYGGCFYG